MPELMQAVDRYARTARDPMDRVADRLGAEALALARPQQRPLTEARVPLEHVVSPGQIGLKALQDHLRQRHAALLAGLAAIDPQHAFGPIEARNVEPLEFPATQPRSVQQREYRHPQVRAPLSTPAACLAPQCLHVRAVNALR